MKAFFTIRIIIDVIPTKIRRLAPVCQCGFLYQVFLYIYYAILYVVFAQQLYPSFLSVGIKHFRP